MYGKVEAAAIPVVKQVMPLQDSHQAHYHNERVRRLSGRSPENRLLFGGHAVPVLDTPYQVTLKDNRDSCHAISMMKVHVLMSVCLHCVFTHCPAA